jgi:hypothetical protein
MCKVICQIRMLWYLTHVTTTINISSCTCIQLDEWETIEQKNLTSFDFLLKEHQNLEFLSLVFMEKQETYTKYCLYLQFPGVSFKF